MAVVDGSYGRPMKLEENAALPLAGGIMQRGYQCGMIWGAALAAGAEAYRRFGVGPQAETKAVMAARRIVDAFRASNNAVDCLDITGINKSSSNREMTTYFFLKGGVVKCFRMAARYAPVAFGEINTALDEDHVKLPSPPIGCAAVFAQKMGVSDMHRVMAAGLAGGIGLSGGGCGAIDRFAKCTNGEFECSKIVGRRFEDIGDHADYLRSGGCSKIIEALAAG